MKQKIEWYREVLELEPGSRVFFPLAKLLAADGQTADAVYALHQGLLRHPDNVEARLLLVELLFLQNADAELFAEIDKLGKLFAAYPGFWKAWSERISAIPAMRDAALAMRFFAASLQGKNIGWGEIIEYGLNSILSTEEHTVAFSAPQLSEREESAILRAAPSLPAQQEEPRAQPLPDAPDIPASIFDTAPEEHTQSASNKDFSSEQAQEEDAEEDDPEEVFSLRTRSMAEVLAEQGDISGALDIYQELMETAAPDEKTSLEARAEELAGRIHVGAVIETDKEEDKNKASGGESTRLVNLLESLAQRLEARAR